VLFIGGNCYFPWFIVGAVCFSLLVFPDGELIWAVSAGSKSGDDQGMAVKVDAEGNILVTGVFSGLSHFGDSTKVTSRYSILFLLHLARTQQIKIQFLCVCNKSCSELLVVCTAVASASLSQAAWMLCRTMPYHMLCHLHVPRGQSDIFVAKYSPGGEVLWVRSAGGSGEDTSHGIAGAVTHTHTHVRTYTHR
jgi:hypothetical protein